MPIKQENEITIRILCSKEELIKHLEEKGLKKGRKFRLDDHYLIPKTLRRFIKLLSRKPTLPTSS